MTALWTAGIVAACTGAESEAPAADPATVDRYITELARAEQASAPDTARDGAEEKLQPPVSDKIAKDAGGRVDRAEPVVGAVLTMAD